MEVPDLFVDDVRTFFRHCGSAGDGARPPVRSLPPRTHVAIGAAIGAVALFERKLR